MNWSEITDRGQRQGMGNRHGNKTRYTWSVAIGIEERPGRMLQNHYIPPTPILICRTSDGSGSKNSIEAKLKLWMLKDVLTAANQH